VPIDGIPIKNKVVVLHEVTIKSNGQEDGQKGAAHGVVGVVL
jgi:hypothetical protein